MSLLISLLTAFFILHSYSSPDLLKIKTPTDTLIYDIKDNRKIVAKGLLGDSIIIIDNGKAFFENSPCPNKLCVKTGVIDTAGSAIGCMPNWVSIMIESKNKKNQTEKNIDSLSY